MLRAASRNLGVKSNISRTDFVSPRSICETSALFNSLQIGFAHIGLELLPHLRLVEPRLRQQQQAVHHVGQLARGRVRRAFALEHDAQTVSVGFSRHGDPFELVE